MLRTEEKTTLLHWTLVPSTETCILFFSISTLHYYLHQYDLQFMNSYRGSE
jgi:hypothetical protein